MSRLISFVKRTWILFVLMLVIGFLSLFDSAKVADRALQDYIFTINSPTRSEDIFVIGIDHNTLEEIGPWGTWSRGVLGELINTLNADPINAPSVIGIDIMYFGNKEDDLEGDESLALAAEAAGNVVVANEIIFGKEMDNEGSFDFFVVDKIDQPYDELKSVTKQGFINTIPDIADNKVRKSLHKVTYDEEEYYSFAYEIYKLYAEKNGLPLKKQPKLDSRNQWNIEYSSGDYGGYSLSKVLSGEIPASEFKDGIVIVGPYSTGMQDGYFTPIDNNQLFGVDIHANIVQCLLDNRFKHEAPRNIQTCILLALMIVLHVCFRKINIKLSSLIFVAAMFCGLAIPFLLYRIGIVISIFYPLLSVILLYLLCLVRNYVLEIVRRKRITDNFKKYVAPQVVDTLVKDGIDELKLGGVKRNIAVLFVDIRGFSTMSEKLNPEQVVEILNDYLNLTSTAIFKFGGTLDKFIGDATMAVFNAPLDIDKPVLKAICAALDMLKGAVELGEKSLKKYGIKVTFGIGINYGTAIVGNIGASFRMEYTAIGDTVNTAQRLESNAKPGQILISESVYEEVKKFVKVTPIGIIPLKGKSEEISVYQLDGLAVEHIEKELRE
ncbi:adenylate/guanylate cyclase domain-containing protein [Ruminiclostridium herbifermentans]|uniref:Adenylate/guanylate cyclase domain-containing protein n=1 Tax=Ruminiclostridium herbifermentans TaxID=2488810 RepID=A0A4U7JHI3_9FIRM|nr:adenylate/guanylate cyclase domain-containing protein [Ruminiclostridium herbifermentans]QNU67406.1 adenylate/guanylate cyclase domain-containing protein [Ruminiclostridium herbifermentans]